MVRISLLRRSIGVNMRAPLRRARARGISSLNAACSPGRSDHYDAIAVEWLRRWRPETTAVALPQCCCPAGRCETCN